MYTAIRNRRTITAAQNQFLSTVRNALPWKLPNITVGFQGEHFKVKQVFGNNTIWFAYNRLTNAPIPRHWNAFGSGQPEVQRSNSITVETNIGLQDSPKSLGALYAEDGDTGSIALLHRGKIGGGGKGIGKNAFMRWYSGEMVHFVDPANSDNPETAILVTELNSDRFIQNIEFFVHAVRQFKSHVRQPNLSSLSVSELKKKADTVHKTPKSSTNIQVVFARDRFVSELAKRRAQGKCELCKKMAPFNNAAGEPYLESHHINWLAHGGSDTIDNTVALCPNCHRKMHIVQDARAVTLLKRRALKSIHS